MNRIQVSMALAALLSTLAGGAAAQTPPTPPTPAAEPPPPPPPPEPAPPIQTLEDDDRDDRERERDRDDDDDRGHRGHHGHMAGRRPLDPTLGLGFGYALPTSWDSPNVTSVRFRLPSGLTLEPRVELGLAGSSTDTAAGETENDFVGVTLGSRVRLPLASRGAADLLAVGGAQVAFASQDPEGDDNAQRSTTFDLSWGVGIDFWLRHWMSISTTATNPLFSYSRDVQETAGEDSKSSSFAFGAVFDPQLDLMLHLFF
jgi:hypothetical protein